MKILKIVLSIGGLLFIGFISGFYVHRVVAMQKIEQLRKMDRAPEFERRFFESIQATEEQRKLLEPIIAEQGDKMAALIQESREKRQALMQEFHQAIAPHLTDEQILKLEKFSRRFARGKKMKKNRPFGKKSSE